MPTKVGTYPGDSRTMWHTVVGGGGGGAAPRGVGCLRPGGGPTTTKINRACYDVYEYIKQKKNNHNTSKKILWVVV